ncbi:transmembrane protein, putative (macronuclear) [Tetrahymena thermophila SB210]|uniref:Transmembrane protein, putative n=1 Tax=Tetrahymena thermophila (strain SB210) TaxID=312017 RepID=W7XCD4_TETTS|nr:transmembrane protein, putative [Tetrahymena thermophila SB210]EWS74208.1 transmembrane protein, putative [Tetrahymena thermophila SB210]|eukprot:XP_012653268.1 transmembrane protein, putative [Tetrahymena thermophila SB210]
MFILPFLLFATFHLSLQNSFKEHAQGDIQLPIQKRQLQSCPQFCDVCDDSGYCLQCCNCDLRVLPTCDCQMGYYDFEGSCLPCKEGCMSCTSADSCLECQSTYIKDPSTNNCICDISNEAGDCKNPDEGFLIYYSRFMNDFKSIEVIFNQMINIIGVDLIEQFQAQSSTNCQILDSQTISIYQGSAYTCFIDSLRRNRFIISFSSLSQSLDQNKFFSNPIIDQTKINIQNKQNEIEVKKIYNLEKKVGDQHHSRQKICYFNYKNLMSNPKQDQIITSFSYFDNNFENMINYLQATITSPQQYTGIQLDIMGQTIQLSNYLQIIQEGPITISLQCQLFDIITIDTATVQITFQQSPNKNIFISSLIYYQNIIQGRYDQKIQQSLNFNVLQDYQLKIQTLPQIIDTQIIQLTEASNLFTINLPAYSAKYTETIYIMQQVIDKTGTVVAQQNIAYLNHNIQYIPNLTQTLTNINPQNDLWIDVDITQFQLAESNKIDPKYVSQSWFCVDANNNPCLNASQQPLQIIQLSNKMKVKKNQLSFNTIYFFFYQLQSNNFQYSSQYQKFSVDTGLTYAYATIQGQQSSGHINLQDILSIIIYIHTDFPYQIEKALYTINLVQNGQKKILTSTSNQFSVQIQDYFPNPDFSQKPTELIISYSIYDYYFKQNILMQDPSNPVILEISSPDQLQIEINPLNYIAFTELITIQSTSSTSKIFQFFYYNNAQDREFELQNPYQTTRKLLSLDQPDQHITSYLPFGDVVIMLLGFNPDIYQYTNVTYVLPVKDNNFNPQSYINYIQEKYKKAQSYQQQSQLTKEIFVYQTMIEAIEQYEKKDNIVDQVVSQIKQNILLRLQNNIWQNQIDQIFNLSGEITLRMIRTKIQLDSLLFNKIVDQTVNRIKKLNQSIQQIQSYLNQKLKFQYQESFRITIQTYMELVKISGNSGQISEQSMIQNTVNAMGGLSILLHTNQSPIKLFTSAALIQVEKYDDILFMSNYFQQLTTVDKNSFLNQNQFYILTQSWPNNTFLFRDELEVYNEKYMMLANKTTLNLLQTTYSIKIPTVIPILFSKNEDSRRRFLQQEQDSNIPSDFVITFSNITEQEQLKCIQRSNSGQWVSKSCKTNLVINGHQRQIECICKTPDVTSIIADAEALLNNENLSNIFSESGIEGLLNLKNWYEYVAIWTIFGLNIFYVCLACIARKFDKRDNLKISDLQQHETQKEQEVLNKETKQNEKVFILIKARKSTFLRLSNTLENGKKILQKQQLEQEKVNNVCDNAILQSQIKEQELTEVQSCQIQDKSKFSIQSLRQIENHHETTINKNLSQKPTCDQLCGEKQTNISINIQNNSYLKPIQCIFAAKEDEFISKNIKIHQQGEDKDSHSKILCSKLQIDKSHELSEEGKKENIIESQHSIQLKYHLNDGKISPKNKNQHHMTDDSFIQSKIKDDQIQQRNSNENVEQDYNQTKGSDQDKQTQKEEKKKLKKAKKELAKQKLIEYLNQEKVTFGILSFHQFFSIFFIYYESQSRVLRSSIFYNKMVWLLALNSIFGKNLSIVQILILSIVSSIVLWVVTLIISIFLDKKKFQKLGIFIVFSFCIFCYYSILVVISRSSAYESNIWVITYFSTLILNEFLFGMIKSTAQYFICKKVLQKIQNKHILSMLGAGLLLKTLSV